MDGPDAVFLDRDGTLNVEPVDRYIADPAELALLPGAAEAVRQLNQAGVPVFVVTNQQGVATGRISPGALTAVHDRLVELLAAEGAHVDAIYVCPHQEGTCDCRKPADGLLRAAFAEHEGVVPDRCAIVGDSLTDVRAGGPLGLTTVLLSSAPHPSDEPDLVAPDLLAATRWLLACRPGPETPS